MENKLPKGWKTPLLGETITIKSGNSKLTKKKYVADGKYVAFSGSGPDGKTDFYEHEGDAIILSAVGARCGKCFRANGKWTAIANTSIIRSKVDNKDVYRYLFYMFNNEYFWPRGGTGQPFVKTGVASKEIHIPYPPISEQKRIADKLDVLLAKVKDAQSRLDKIPLILKRFRRTILATAFSGELTKEWRAKNTAYSANDDMECIKNFLLKSKITNREKNVVQEIYKISLNSYEEQFIIPLSWRACCVGMVGLINNGSTPSRKIAHYWNGTIPWISSGEVRNNMINESREKITQKGLDNCSSKLFPSGTVLIAMIGEGKTRGQSAILNIDAAINQNVAAIQIGHGKINPEYLWLWFQYQYENNRAYGSGSGPQALNCQRVRELPFVLAPKEEQAQVVEKIKLNFGELDDFIKRYRKARNYIDKLEQSILAKAFRGELVIQSPNNDLDNECDDKKDMTIYRTDIEKALDEMISNEEGMRFQGLAVVLAKLKWPAFIASERHKDLGLDAYAPALCVSDSTEKGLASSITATINKIKEDVERFKPHYPNVKVLIFATPRKVTNQQAKSWKETIWKDYGIELQILSKEDVITDLMLPDNASICSSHLNIYITVEQTTQDLVAKAREATGEILATWLAHPRLAGKPKIALQSVKLDENGRETQEVLTLNYFQQALLEGRRIILEAPAGRGKTTTLIQLAGRMDQLFFLIDLPTWVKSNNNIFEFISQMPPFLSRRIDATTLAQIYNAAPCSFLLNGWNEISDIYSDKAVSALSDLERNFPKAGIIVATRAHHIKPPLPGSFRVQLLSLNQRQRVEYLNQALANRSGELISQLENDRVLNDLARTPLILSEVVNIFLSGAAIPKTKLGILDAVVRLAEESDEHRDHLARSPLLGKSRDCLADLAVQMTKAGTVTMEETCARSVVSSMSRNLQAEGQITTLPEPAEILSTLCAHHVLERLEYPSVAFRFQHQQFQEWYVSTVLRKCLLELVDNNNQEVNRNFIREYINKPLWEEPLRMIAEDIGDLNADSSDVQRLVEAGRMLVEFALGVDPVFAAELARLCGKAVWVEVKDKVGQRLRSWYQTEDDYHKRCALAGMIASGSEDFKDILLPLLTSDDQQVRLRAYRSFKEFHVSSLGKNWKQMVKTWKDDHRADFIGEVVREPYMADVAEEFARIDSSPKVRAVALNALEWISANEALNRVLTSYNDDTFKDVLCKRILHEIPQEVRERAIAVYNMLLQEIDTPKDRLRIRLAIAKIGGEFVIEDIKDELTKWPSEKLRDGEELLIKSAIELVQKSEPDWVSYWVATRIIEGLLWSDRWATFISNLPQSFKQNLLKRIGEEALEHRDNSAIVSVLVATADVKLARDVFSGLCSLQIDTLNSPEKATKTQAEIIRQLQDLFRAMPSDAAISGMMNRLSSKFNPAEHQVAVELLGRIGDTGSNLRSQLPAGLRQALRTYLKKGVSSVLNQDDFSGFLKSELATALARVGDPEDVVDLNKLIQADIERMRRGLEARRKGDRGPIGNGAVMSYSNWHVRAVECLDFQGAEDVLLRVLCEPEYEQDAAKALIHLARINNPEVQHAFKRTNYRVLWEARSGRQEISFDEGRRRCYVNAIKQRIVMIRGQQSQSDNPDSFTGRLKMLACVVAVLDGRESMDLVMEIMALPGEWDGYTRVEVLETLLFSGALIKADEALKVLNPTIEHAIRELHNQQSRYLLQRCLCLLPFLDPSSAGIARIKEIMTATQIPVYDLREILNALGNSRCGEALDLLLELHTKYGSGLNHIRSEWIDAIAAIDTDRSRKILMSFVDSEIEEFSEGNWHFDYHESDGLSSYIVDIACKDPTVKERLFLLCNKQLAPRPRMLLANAMSKLGTSESIRDSLNLIDDRKNPSIPYQLLRGLEGVFLGKRPYGSTGHTYTIESTSANEIRSLLYEMAVGDDTRKRSAWGLLGQIESWRLEYGRPDSEPRHPAFDSGKLWPPIPQGDNLLRPSVI